MAKKVVKTTKVGRGSDQFMVRMPPGMRSALSEEAERSGRSMNAEIVARLDASFEEFLNLEGMVVISKRMTAAINYLEEVIIDIRDMDLIDLDAFIADQQCKGTTLTRRQAVRLILRTYLSENGFVRLPKGKISPPA
jgi:Arc-like DNA binding domain